MRKLSRAGGAAVLAAAVTAGAFTVTPAAQPAAAAMSGHARPGTVAGAIPGTPARLLPGGLAVPAGHQWVAGARATTGTSDLLSANWGGYAAHRGSLRFRYVQATLFVPYLDCASTPDGASSHWVGLDGLFDPVVEQVGVDVVCQHGSPSYQAWWEIFPQAPVYPNITIRPGDSLVASVFYRRRTGKFTLSLTDTTNGRHFSHTAACPSGEACPRASAEVISEAPATAGGTILPLADFRAEAYSSVRVTSQAGQHGSLRGPRWNTAKITMATTSGVLAQPTALYHGSAFGLYWLKPR